MAERPESSDSEDGFISREAYDRGVFGPGSNLEARFIPDYEELERKVEACKALDQKIVLTSGTFDIIHIGHARYLERARQHGDVLVVGVDDDEKVRSRKGEDRPVVPQDERIAMLAHLRAVDMITLKTLSHDHLQLVKTVRPDTLIVTQENYERYSDEELEALNEYCGRIVVLEPQAQTTTSARIRLMHVNLGNRVTEALSKETPEFIRRVIQNLIDNA
ncbi:adenylyltransferase/cytidyltransferase family protein [Candidatus Microgenomates bacterium]|nr:adenylyltransferase/cytidyltransferase family protein [Candidatus Microgenomates bacterium]